MSTMSVPNNLTKTDSAQKPPAAGVALQKKKSDLATAFKTEAVNGELDISNRSKLYFNFLIITVQI